MPLAFDSLNHGTIAFGFFNIEIDMLLLENLFFFADRFCGAVAELSRGREQVSQMEGRTTARVRPDDDDRSATGLLISPSTPRTLGIWYMRSRPSGPQLRFSR